MATELPPDPVSGVDLVVTDYRTPGDLQRFLDSLERNPPSVPWTVSIVLVAPLDDSRAMGKEALRRLDDAGVQAWCSIFPDNVGYARACNRGAGNGSHEVIALFNADVELTAGAVDECVRELTARPDWGVLGPRQVDDRGLLTHAGIFGTPEAPAHRAWKYSDAIGYGDVREDAVTVSGSAYFIKRAVWEELGACPSYRSVARDAEGAFLPTQLYYEETYCSYHARAHGHKVVYYGPARIVHRCNRAVEENRLENWAAATFAMSRETFRSACDSHSPPIPHD